MRIHPKLNPPPWAARLNGNRDFMINSPAYRNILTKAQEYNVLLIVVSKNQSIEDIQILYDLGQRDFGENRVAELLTKYEALPKDIRWHMIGHLQSNKVKYIAPFIHLVHSVDSVGLVSEIDKQAKKNSRTIPCLLQIRIAQEENKYGILQDKVIETLSAVKNLKDISIKGLMGIATNTKEIGQITSEFHNLKLLRDHLIEIEMLRADSQLSIGMSSDWQIALLEGATILRIGSLLFNSVEK